MMLPGALGAYDALFILLAAAASGLAVWNRCLARRLVSRLHGAPTHDALTALPGRVLLLDRLTQAIAVADLRRSGLAVLFVDIDRFKAVNSTFGHGDGDGLLRQMASRLRACAEATDTVARIGSDEFVVVVPGADKPELAASVARKVLARLSSPFTLAGHQVYCTASIGIAMYPGDGTTADALIRNADIAMVRAKDQGRNTLDFFMPEMHENAVHRQRLEGELRAAIERREFVLHYQPRLDVRTGAVSGFEALLRWRHPQQGLVGPAEFVPLLEESDLIVEVGDWALATACRQIRAWADDGMADVHVSVNVSARQFKRAGLDATIERLVREHGISPSQLEIEVTESLLMQDPERTAATLRRLKAMGVLISIDDFGTGYSGLAYLRRFSVDVLKVDRVFLAEVQSQEGAVMARAIIELGHALGLRVVAEGVERPDQAAFLRELGCDEMQGFLFSPALDAVEAGAWKPLPRAID
jgi:diguanylate cyclase (GGDEF)-like protein